MRSSEIGVLCQHLERLLQNIKEWRAALDERQRVQRKLGVLYDRMVSGKLWSESKRKKGGIQFRYPHHWLTSARKTSAAFRNADWTNEANAIDEALKDIGDVPTDRRRWRCNLNDVLQKAADQVLDVATASLKELHTNKKSRSVSPAAGRIKTEQATGTGGAGSTAQTTKEAGDTPLSERCQLALQSMKESKAFDSDHRMTTEEIAVKAEGSRADGNQYKSIIAQLKRFGYVETKKGRAGGCWLTIKGRSRVEKR